MYALPGIQPFLVFGDPYEGCKVRGTNPFWGVIAGVELRFEGSEELGYDPLGTPPRGEICLRGPIVFGGYYQDEAKTKEAFGESLLSHHAA